MVYNNSVRTRQLFFARFLCYHRPLRRINCERVARTLSFYPLAVSRERGRKEAGRPRCLFTSVSYQSCTPLRFLSHQDFKKHIKTLRRFAALGARIALFRENTQWVTEILLDGAYSPFSFASCPNLTLLD